MYYNIPVSYSYLSLEGKFRLELETSFKRGWNERIINKGRIGIHIAYVIKE